MTDYKKNVVSHFSFKGCRKKWQKKSSKKNIGTGNFGYIKKAAKRSSRRSSSKSAGKIIIT